MLDAARFLVKSFGRKPLLVILAVALLLTTALSGVVPAQTSETDKQKVVRQVAQKWIQVGMEQYQRGFFKAAEQSFLRAQDYQEYLTPDEREKLSELLEKTHLAVLERTRVLEHIQTAEQLVKQGKPIKAKAHLEKVRDSGSLTEEERQQITEELGRIDNQINEQKKQITEIYNRSVEFYRSGQLEKARDGFTEVARSGLLAAPEGETAEDYLVKIDRVLAGKPELPPSIEAKPQKQLPETTVAVIEDEDKLLGLETEPAQKSQEEVVQEQKPVAIAEPKAAEPVTDEGNYLEVINRKRNILRSHTRAVVNDAVTKAQNYVSQGEFDKAKEAVETAERAVNKNQLHLGDELFKQYSDQLKQLTEKIAEGRNERDQQLQEQKRLEAVEAQHTYREQMEADRKKRIAELMDNAMAYQKQQRYEEALGQLESLLAIEPLNDQALILKQTLEDTVNFRKQLEIQKESDKERVGILVKTEESMIPYAEELTYPKNWREIAAKRKPEQAIGYDPANAAVYKKLDEIVDLSELTPEMPLSEAITVLRNSVEPPLTIIVLWRDLYDNADIDQTTPINMDAISAVSLGTALELLLKSISGGFAELGYVVDNGVITIATVGSLPSKLETLVYDVADLLGRPADFYAQPTANVSVAGGATAGAQGFQETVVMDSTQLAAQAARRVEQLVMLIQDTIEPDSWYDTGTGEGTITVYENKKLIVRQTREVHNRIEKLLKEMRKSLGYQVAIEARFLVVGENFLEDIGLDIDFRQIGGQTTKETWITPPDYTEGLGPPVPNPGFDPLQPMGYYNLPYLSDGEPEFGNNPFNPLQTILLNPLRETILIPVEGSGVPGVPVTTYDPTKLLINQGSAGHTTPDDTKIPGSWMSSLAEPGLNLTWQGMILDTLQTTLLLRASQAHRDAKSLTAPKVSVLSGESASLRVQRITGYPHNYEFDIQEIGTFGQYYWTVNVEDAWIVTGSLLNITPTITPDRKNVLLHIVAELRDFLGWEDYKISLPNIGGAGTSWTIAYPETEISRVETRVSVPDGGTLLLGGQKLTAEIEKESGVPVLSKIPFLGRVFSNRSKVKDEKILLILVRPTIILQEEAEAEAIAAMEQRAD
jgi:type II secretory pathway component GspD/PulD (secretin)/TolA-binding protein